MSTESSRERLKYEPPYHSPPLYHSFIHSELDTPAQRLYESLVEYMHLMLKNIRRAVRCRSRTLARVRGLIHPRFQRSLHDVARNARSIEETPPDEFSNVTLPSSQSRLESALSKRGNVDPAWGFLTQRTPGMDSAAAVSFPPCSERLRVRPKNVPEAVWIRRRSHRCSWSWVAWQGYACGPYFKHHQCRWGYEYIKCKRLLWTNLTRTGFPIRS